jgi:hypothetical protein
MGIGVSLAETRELAIRSIMQSYEIPANFRSAGRFVHGRPFGERMVRFVSAQLLGAT